MILARPICKIRDTIHVLFEQPKGEKVKIAKANITLLCKINWPVTGNEGERSSDEEVKEDSSSIC